MTKWYVTDVDRNYGVEVFKSRYKALEYARQTCGVRRALYSSSDMIEVREAITRSQGSVRTLFVFNKRGALRHGFEDVLEEQ